MYDEVFPLRMQPRDGVHGSQSFDLFVDSLFHPLSNTNEGGVVAPNAPDSEVSDDESWEVEMIKKKRFKYGTTQYLVKWKGYNNRHNTWRCIDDLECDGLIGDYESKHVSSSAYIADPQFHPLQTKEEVDRQSKLLFGEDDSLALKAVESLMKKEGRKGSPQEYLEGYKAEIQNILQRRMKLQDPAEAVSVRRDHALGRLRMLLELKRDGRKKGRLVVNKEPDQWQVLSNSSPVAFLETIRMLLFMVGSPDDVLSVNDVSVAFLQADDFEDDVEYYVSYKAFKEAQEHVLRLFGPLYGQKCASKRWYITFAKWIKRFQTVYMTIRSLLHDFSDFA